MSLVLANIGLATAFGPGLARALSALADGDPPFFKTPAFVGTDFTRQLCGFQTPERIGTLEQRLPDLMDQACDDLLTTLDPATLPGKTSLQAIIALPEANEEDAIPEQRLSDLTMALARRLSEKFADHPLFALAGARAVQGGQTGAAQVLESILDHGKPDQAYLLICLDSYADVDRLYALEGQQRLFCRDTAYGLIPSEAGGALLLLPEELAQFEGLARINSAGTATEEIGELDNMDSAFTGLSDSAFAALDRLGRGRVSVGLLLSDFNNGRYRAGEVSYCVTRLLAEYLEDGVMPTYPLLSFGDAGAAYLPLAIATAMFEAGATAPDTHAMALASSTHSRDRGSVVFRTSQTAATQVAALTQQAAPAG